MNDYFKPAFERWFYSFSMFWRNIREIPFWLRCCWQRAFRGWSDEDWWNMDSYLITIIIPMLKVLKEKQRGYPGTGKAKTPEGWDKILDEMILGFEAGKRVIDDDYFLETNADILERKPTKDEINLWLEKSNADKKLFDRAMVLFSRWYFALWD